MMNDLNPKIFCDCDDCNAANDRRAEGRHMECFNGVIAMMDSVLDSFCRAFSPLLFRFRSMPSRQRRRALALFRSGSNRTSRLRKKQRDSMQKACFLILGD